MPTIVQFRRGTTAQNDAFTGSTGEISIDSTKDTIRVHDGSTAGGFEMINESGKGAGDDITFESATSNKPVLTLKNTLKSHKLWPDKNRSTSFFYSQHVHNKIY